MIDRPDSAETVRDTSILIVAEHALVRAGLRAVIAAKRGLAVVAEVSTLADAASVVPRFRPDVVLLGAAPTAVDGPALATLRRRLPGACLLCLGDATEAASTIRCVPRDAGVAELCTAIGAALGACGGCALRSGCPTPRIDGAVALSRREQQVAVHVAAGLTSKQIAAALGIGLRTVNTYRESLARKVGASSPAVLTRYVLEHDLDADAAPAR